MNYKKKSIILSVFIILIIQFLLLLNNSQKTSFRYFIWNVSDVSIGKLICISFISGLLMSSILNSTLNDNVKAYPENEQVDNKTDENDYSINIDDNNKSFDIPPERDIRDAQPTISVNYRIIKDNGEDFGTDRKQTSNRTESQDDWGNKESEW